MSNGEWSRRYRREQGRRWPRLTRTWNKRFWVPIELAQRSHACDFAHFCDSLIMKVIITLVVQLHQKSFKLLKKESQIWRLVSCFSHIHKIVSHFAKRKICDHKNLRWKTSNTNSCQNACLLHTSSKKSYTTTTTTKTTLQMCFHGCMWCIQLILVR